MLQSKVQEVSLFLPSSVNKRTQTLNNGVEFPMITFGTSKIEGLNNIYKAVNIALAAGYRSFECEPKCDQEEFLGLTLEDLLPKYNLKRKDVFIVGKIFPINYGVDTTTEALWQTCINLRTDYLDLYLMQWPGRFHTEPDDIENLYVRCETWIEMTNLAKKGAIRSIGVCNFEVKHLEYFRELKYITPAVNQVEFHPRLPQKHLLNYCKKNNILLQAISFKNTLHPLVTSDNTIRKVAREIKKTPTQVALKWILNNGVAVIPQSEKPNTIKKNFCLYDFVLEKYDMDAINSITERQKFLINPITVI